MAAFYFPDYDCVLLHIPKTAGSSIRNGFFEGRYEGPVQGSIPEPWLGKFKFTFIRNPYDRLISAWRMFASGMQNTKWEYPEDGRPGLSLREFLEIAADESIPYDGVRTTFERKVRHHVLPQTHPFYCLQQADYVGRFERLKEDFAAICERIGAKGTLPHWNQTERDDYRHYFDAETKAMTEAFYAEDFRALDYPLESFDD